MTGPVPAGIVEAAADAVEQRLRFYTRPPEPHGQVGWGASCDELARVALAVVLPKVADQIEALRIEPLGSEYLAGGNHALRDAAKLIRSLAEGLGDE